MVQETQDKQNTSNQYLGEDPRHVAPISSNLMQEPYKR